MNHIVKVAESKIIALGLSLISAVMLIFIGILLENFVSEMKCTRVQSITNKHNIETLVIEVNSNTGEIVYIKKRIDELRPGGEG